MAKIMVVRSESPQALAKPPVWAAMPTIVQYTFPMVCLHDENLWGQLRSINNIYMARLDYRHWCFEDDVFEAYIRKLVLLNLPAFVFSESPYTEFPYKTELRDLQKKLLQRSELVRTLFRNLSPQTLLVAPSFNIVEPEYREAQLDYFVHSRGWFDVYALNGMHDYSEQSVALLSSLMTQVLKVLHRPVWVIPWSVPSSDITITDPFTIGLSLKLMSCEQAALKLRSFFRTVEQITSGNVKWFFTGSVADEYQPGNSVADWRQFVGLSDHQGNFKQPIIDMLIQLSE